MAVLALPETEATYETLSTTGHIRTVVVDDSPMFLEVVCALLERDGEIDVVAHAVHGLDAIYVVERLRPDLVLMDVEMPFLDGMSVAVLIANRHPQTKIVLMSSEERERMWPECMACGADAFIHKPAFRAEFPRVFNSLSFSTNER